MPEQRMEHAIEARSLADILERVLDKGIVIAGDITISLVEVELLNIKLRLLVASIDKAMQIGINWWESDPYLSSRAKQLEVENQILLKRLDQLEAKLEAETARRQDLERRRDLAWETYATLAKKEAEVIVAAQSGGTEVRLASRAVPPSSSSAPRKSLNVAVGGALGLVLGAFGAFAIEWWQDNGRQVERQSDEGSDEETNEQDT